MCFDLCQQLVDGVITVKTDQICAAIKDVFTENRSILEPAGAVAVAGAKAFCAAHGVVGDVVAVTSGANMNFDRLRIVSQLADGGLKQEATLVSVIPETNGSFKTFAEAVGADVNFTEFKYRAVSGRDARGGGAVLRADRVRGAARDGVHASLSEAGILHGERDGRRDDAGAPAAHGGRRHGGAAGRAHVRGGDPGEGGGAGHVPRRLRLAGKYQITMTHYRSDGGR